MRGTESFGKHLVKVYVTRRQDRHLPDNYLVLFTDEKFADGRVLALDIYTECGAVWSEWCEVWPADYRAWGQRVPLDGMSTLARAHLVARAD